MTPPPCNQLKYLTPQDGLFEMSYRYLVTPLYTVFPKPGEFYKVIGYFSSARNTKDNATLDLIYDAGRDEPIGCSIVERLGFIHGL